MPAASCPVTCPCRRAVAGIVILSMCTYIALYSSDIIGPPFSVLVGHLFGGVVSGDLVLLLLGFLLGGYLLATGFVPAVLEGAGPVSWVLASAASASALWLSSWYWHGGGFYGPMLSFSAVKIALIAGPSVLALNLAGSMYHRGTLESSSGGLLGPLGAARARPDSPDLQRALREAHAEIGRLKADLQAALPPQDVVMVLSLPDVRKAALKALHRDTRPGIPEIEARAMDAKFQAAQKVFVSIENLRS
jgi:hypothetical protein